jgi:heme-degrading monooxygenase HmoA
MSVLMLLRVKGDAAKVEQAVRDDQLVLKTIVDRAKSHGLIRHRFFGTADEIIVVDEWPDEASFHKFFDASPDIQEVMAAAGVTTPPEITFARQLDVNDSFG